MSEDYSAIAILIEERRLLRDGIKEALRVYFTGGNPEQAAQALIDAKAIADGLYGGSVVVPLKVCHYCGERQSGVVKLTRDHVVPRSRGGSSEGWNIVWSCGPCNGRKANLWPTCDCEFCEQAVALHAERFGLTRLNAGYGPLAARRELTQHLPTCEYDPGSLECR